MRRARDPGLAVALTLCGNLAWADMAYVTCQSGNELGVVDLMEGRQVARWPLPGNPAGIAVGQDLFTVSTEGKTVRRLAPDGGEVLAEHRIDGGPMGIALDADRGRVIVSDWFKARLLVLDAGTLAPLTELATGAAPAGVAISPDGRFLASAEKDADRVTIFDAETLARTQAVTVGTRPFGLRFAPDGRLFVGNVGSNDVTVIDPASGSVLATIAVGERPYGIAFALGRAFVTNQYSGTVSVFELATFAPVATIAVGDYPEGIDSTEDGGRVVLANWFDNSLSVLDARTLDVLDTIDTCDGPRAFGTFLRGGSRQ